MDLVSGRAATHLVRAALIPAGISDPRVQQAMGEVPRHLFVPTELRHQAYGNHSLPIGQGQTISAPLTVAKSLQALELSGGEAVLEIGTGSGYQAAVLARLCRKVYTVERLLPFVHLAKSRFAALGMQNIMVRFGDGYQGWPAFAPYDAVVCAAVLPAVPEALGAQLRPGGCLVAPVKRKGGGERLLRLRRDRFGLRLVDDLGDCAFVPMIEEKRR